MTLQPLVHSKPNTIEHPLDVFRWAQSAFNENNKIALVVITDILGGAVRARGSIMAVAENGSHAGYVSGGCIDEDVVLQAVDCIKHDNAKKIRYGEGSQFFDLKLPCGGAIEVSIFPIASIAFLQNCIEHLSSRRPITLRLNMTTGAEFVSSLTECPSQEGESTYFRYIPKLKIRIAGRGADPIALANISLMAGFEISFQSPDPITLDAFKEHPLSVSSHLQHPQHLPSNIDDEWTAFVLMFHDSDWEIPLLLDALSGNAFFIGAVGSHKTHKKRIQRLISAGCAQKNIEAIHAPVGLVPSLRDASTLAISTLAQIIQHFQSRYQN